MGGAWGPHHDARRCDMLKNHITILRNHITNNMITKVATIPQISVNMDLFPLPDIRYVFGLILISLYLFFLLMFFSPIT